MYTQTDTLNNSFFLINDTASTEIYTLSLHDALPIYAQIVSVRRHPRGEAGHQRASGDGQHHAGEPEAPLLRLEEGDDAGRSEEHTSELQSHQYVVCRLLLENHCQESPHRGLS